MIATIQALLGTQPEIIAISPLIRKLVRLANNFTFRCTSQHDSCAINQIFFEQLGVLVIQRTFCLNCVQTTRKLNNFKISMIRVM
jgi:UDP-N-acetylglucosamine 2-epimerase